MMKTLSKNGIVAIHAFLAKEFGGRTGLQNEAALDDAIAISEKGKDLFEKAARLMVEIVARAPFTERNVRTAFFTADALLRLNGFYLRCDSVVTQRFFSSLLEGDQFTIDNLLPWIKSNAEKQNT